MAVNAPYVDFLAVDVEAVVWTGLNGAEAELVALYVQCIAVFVNQSKLYLVAVRGLGDSQAGVVNIE